MSSVQYTVYHELPYVLYSGYGVLCTQYNELCSVNCIMHSLWSAILIFTVILHVQSNYKSLDKKGCVPRIYQVLKPLLSADWLTLNRAIVQNIVISLKAVLSWNLSRHMIAAIKCHRHACEWLCNSIRVTKCDLAVKLGICPETDCLLVRPQRTPCS